MHAHMGSRARGEGEGPVFSSSNWPFAAASRAWQATQCYPTAKSGFQSLLLLWLLPLPSLLLLLLLLLLLKTNACVVSWLGGWVARLRRVGSCCSRCPRFSRYKQP